MHQDEADNTTDEDQKKSEQVMADLLTGFGAATKQLEQQRSEVADVVQVVFVHVPLPKNHKSSVEHIVLYCNM
jgi:hypothetical protein